MIRTIRLDAQKEALGCSISIENRGAGGHSRANSKLKMEDGAKRGANADAICGKS